MAKKEEKKEEKEDNEEEQPSELYKSLANIVGEDRVKEDKLERLLYSHDLAALPGVMKLLFNLKPDVIVRPRNSQDVSKIVKLASEKNIPLVPRGAASWAFGGCVPAFGGIVLDMGSMQKILEVDKKNMCVRVEPGVPWEALYDTLLRQGLFVGAYPSSAPSASVGGWINTGGIGIGSYKFGGVGDEVRSLKVVTPDGTIIQTGNRMLMNNTSGFNLTGLFVGSEGTLGVITEATLKVYPAPEDVRPISFIFPDLEHAMDAIKGLCRTNINPYHISFQDGEHFNLLRKIGKHAPEIGALVNFVFNGHKEIINAEIKITKEIMKKFNGKPAPKEIYEHEWNEKFYEARVRRLGPGFLLGEVFAPIANIKQMAVDSKKVLKKLKLPGAVVGIVSDNNTVLFMPYAIANENKAISNLLSMSIVKKLTNAAYKNGGRPIGFGLLFGGNLKKINKDATYIMDDLKEGLDPEGIMNPGTPPRHGAWHGGHGRWETALGQEQTDPQEP